MKEDHTAAAAIIDLVLENVELHKMPKEKGFSPTYCLGLSDGNTYARVVSMLRDYREANQ